MPWIFLLFSCIRLPRGVQEDRELIELRRDMDDSTGLNSAATLNTPLLRCESRTKWSRF